MNVINVKKKRGDVGIGKKIYRCCNLSKISVAAATIFVLSLPGIAMGSDMATQNAAAGNNPLLETLIRKGVLTRQEAVQVQQETEAHEQQKSEQMAKEIKDKAVPNIFKGLKIEALGYIDYSAGQRGAQEIPRPATTNST